MSWCSIVGWISWGWGWLVSSTLLYPSLFWNDGQDKEPKIGCISSSWGWLVSHIVLAQLATEGSLAKLRAEFRTGDEGWQISKDRQRDMLDYRCVLYTKVNDPIPQVSPHVYWSYLLTLPLMIVNGKPFLIWRWKPQIEGLNLTMMMNYEWLWSLGFQEQVMIVFCSKIRGDLNILMEERGISSN